MPDLPTFESLSRALFLSDPMHTCCVENDCFDEYDRVAAGVLVRLEAGEMLESALRAELSDWFDIEMANRIDLTSVLSHIKESSLGSVSTRDGRKPGEVSMARDELNQPKAAVASDGQTHPMPRRHVVLPLSFELDEQQAKAIRLGYVPEEMEEKWFWYFADNVLYQHRSWTGHMIDQVFFEPTGNGLRATHAKVNRSPKQYSNTDDAYDIKRIEDMVMDLVRMNIRR